MEYEPKNTKNNKTCFSKMDFFKPIKKVAKFKLSPIYDLFHLAHFMEKLQHVLCSLVTLSLIWNLIDNLMLL